jgi:hypothetical protein
MSARAGGGTTAGMQDRSSVVAKRARVARRARPAWGVCAVWTVGIVGLGVGCKRPRPVCEQVLGRWNGEGVEGAPAMFEAVLREAMRRERWTLDRATLVRDGISRERVRAAREEPGVCVLELTREDGGAGRMLALTPGDDGRMRAVALRSRSAFSAGTPEGAVIVLRRAGP